MNLTFGPWVSAMGDQRLNTFWRRRLSLLPRTSRGRATLSLRASYGLLAAALMFCAIPTFVHLGLADVNGVEPRSEASENKSKPKPASAMKTYQLDLRLVEVSKNGDEKTVANPSLIVEEGHEGTFCCGGQLLFETDSPSGSKTHRTQLGTSVKVKVTPSEPGAVLLNAVLENTHAERSHEHGVRVDGDTLRVLEIIKLGEPITLKMPGDKKYVVYKDKHEFDNVVKLTVREK